MTQHEYRHELQQYEAEIRTAEAKYALAHTQEQRRAALDAIDSAIHAEAMLHNYYCDQHTVSDNTEAVW